MTFEPHVHLLAVETSGPRVSIDGILEISSLFLGHENGQERPFTKEGLQAVIEALRGHLNEESKGWLGGNENQAIGGGRYLFGQPDGSLAATVREELPLQDGLRAELIRMRFKGTRRYVEEGQHFEHLKRSRLNPGEMWSLASFQEVFVEAREWNFGEETTVWPGDARAMSKWIENTNDTPVVMGEGLFRTFAFLQKGFDIGNEAILGTSLRPKEPDPIPFPYTALPYDIYDICSVVNILASRAARLDSYGRQSSSEFVRGLPALPVKDLCFDLVYLLEALLQEELLREAVNGGLLS